MLLGLGLLLVSLKGVANVSSLVPVASSPAIHLSPGEGLSALQLRSTGIRNPLAVLSFRSGRTDSILNDSNRRGISISIREIDDNFLTICRISLALGLLLVSLKGVANVSSLVPVASSPAIHLSPGEGLSALQLRSTGIRNPLAVLSFRSGRTDSILNDSNRRGISISIREIDDNFLTICRISRFCKRCKRHTHDNHEHSRQQSQQTSFEVRFLHVNFSYSLKFI